MGESTLYAAMLVVLGFLFYASAQQARRPAISTQLSIPTQASPPPGQLRPRPTEKYSWAAVSTRNARPYTEGFAGSRQVNRRISERRRHRSKRPCARRAE